MKSQTQTNQLLQNQEHQRCLYCGQFAPIVWVHGHGQCTSCGINVDECCRGESLCSNSDPRVKN